MAITTIRDLLKAGAHFGAPASEWNPRMAPFIHAKRNRIHIIDLEHTVRGLTRAAKFLEEVAATGRQVVYVCTKRHMRDIILKESDRTRMPWVTERWLGGTLTNFKTVRSRLEALEEMEETLAADTLSKKAASMMMRKARRIRKNLSGLRSLSRIPGAMLVVDPSREHIAVREAARVGVPVVAILDTDCDPRNVDIPIPANDDSMNVIQMLLGKLSDAVAEGVHRFEASGRAPEDAVGVIEDGEFRAHDTGPAAGKDDASDKEAAGTAEAEAPASAESGESPEKTPAATAAAAPAPAPAAAGAETTDAATPPTQDDQTGTTTP